MGLFLSEAPLSLCARDYPKKGIVNRMIVIEAQSRDALRICEGSASAGGRLLAQVNTGFNLKAECWLG